jgi:hypothetical protein
MSQDLEREAAAIGYRRVKPLDMHKRAANKVYYRKNKLRIRARRRARYQHEKSIENSRKRFLKSRTVHTHPILSYLHKKLFNKPLPKLPTPAPSNPFKMRKYNPTFQRIRRLQDHD